MCGRFALTHDGDQLAAEFELDGLADWQPRYNIAPGQTTATIVHNDDAGALLRLRWGLVPSWAKEPRIGYRMINARAETVASKPAFRAAFRRRRCLVLADGYFEWARRDSGPKQPYFIHFPERPVFCFAGLWEHWQGDDAEPLQTFTIITREAPDYLAPIHDRVPVILAAAARAEWLAPDTAPERLGALLDSSTEVALEADPVSTHVNKPANDDPDCIAPVAEAG